MREISLRDRMEIPEVRHDNHIYLIRTESVVLFQ